MRVDLWTYDLAGRGNNGGLGADDIQDCPVKVVLEDIKKCLAQDPKWVAHITAYVLSGEEDANELAAALSLQAKVEDGQWVVEIDRSKRQGSKVAKEGDLLLIETDKGFFAGISSGQGRKQNPDPDELFEIIKNTDNIVIGVSDEGEALRVQRPASVTVEDFHAYFPKGEKVKREIFRSENVN